MNLRNIAIGMGVVFIAVLIWAIFIYTPKEFSAKYPNCNVNAEND